MTKAQLTSKWSDVKPEGYYVYIHRRSTDGEVFYVGKGKKDRAWIRNRVASKRWTRTALAHGVIVEIVEDNLSEDRAFRLEEEIIELHKTEHLCNHSNGGEGRSGVPASYRQRVNTSKAKSVPVECSNGMSFTSMTKAVEWLKGMGHKKAATGNISSACKGQKAHAYGYTWAYKGEVIPDMVDRRALHAKTKRKKVYGVELNMVFKTAAEAASWLKNNGYPKASNQNISACANGKRPSAYGSAWVFC